MNVGRIVKVALAAGIVYNIFDYIVLNYVLAGTMASIASISNPEPSMIANAINNFGAGLMVALVFDKVRASFGPGAGGGLTFGIYAGLLVNIPVWLGLHVFLKDISYGTAWVFTTYGIVAYTVMGATAGFVYNLGEAKTA